MKTKVLERPEKTQMNFLRRTVRFFMRKKETCACKMQSLKSVGVTIPEPCVRQRYRVTKAGNSIRWIFGVTIPEPCARPQRYWVTKAGNSIRWIFRVTNNRRYATQKLVSPIGRADQRGWLRDQRKGEWGRGPMGGVRGVNVEFGIRVLSDRNKWN